MLIALYTDNNGSTYGTQGDTVEDTYQKLGDYTDLDDIRFSEIEWFKAEKITVKLETTYKIEE